MKLFDVLIVFIYFPSRQWWVSQFRRDGAVVGFQRHRPSDASGSLGRRQRGLDGRPVGHRSDAQRRADHPNRRRRYRRTISSSSHPPGATKFPTTTATTAAAATPTEGEA